VQIGVERREGEEHGQTEAASSNEGRSEPKMTAPRRNKDKEKITDVIFASHSHHFSFVIFSTLHISALGFDSLRV
jgi:hypothetical protein